ncbi:MAG: hypothetical protein Q9196_002584 [Gyalolechia fulgens]
MDSTGSASKDVRATFKYLQWDDLFHKEKPFEILIDIPPEAVDQRKTNLKFHEADEEVVQDVRSHISDFTLDEHGFIYIKHQSQLVPEHFKDRDMVERVYLPECESLLRTHVENVDQVYFYNWRLRCSEDPSRQGSIINFSDPTYPLGAAVHVHVDQSPATVVERVGIHLPGQEDFLLQGRVQHINIWRPINGPIENYPLAVCDGRSIPVENLIETDRIRRQYSGCTLFSTYQEGFRWYYASQQNDDEPLLFKSFDSRSDVTRCKS